MILHLQSVPPRNGFVWVRHGLKVMQRKPFALMGLFALAIVVPGLVSIVPVIGPLLALAALPLISLGFMLASHQVLQSHTPTASVFMQPLQLTPERRKAQLMLGLAYAVLFILIMLLSQWVDAGATERFRTVMQAGPKADPQAVAAAATDPNLLASMLTQSVLLTLISIPFWHAPALIHWGGQSVLQALFSSTLGVWRNKGAFAMSGLAWIGLVFGASMVISLALALLGLANLMFIASVPLVLVIGTAFYCSLYFTFIDCFMFGAPRDLPVPPPHPPVPPAPPTSSGSGPGTTNSQSLPPSDPPH